MYSGENTVLPVGLYGSENWSLILRQKRRLRVFENGMLRRNFGLKEDEITREWIKLHNEELYDRYSSQNIIRVINSRRWGWAGHVACMEDRRGTYRILKREKHLLEDLGVDGRIILKCIFNKWKVYGLDRPSSE